MDSSVTGAARIDEKSEMEKQAETEQCTSLTPTAVTTEPNDNKSCCCKIMPPEWCITSVRTLVSMLLYFFDTVLDIWMYVEFKNKGHLIFANLTFFFFLVPAVVVSVISSIPYWNLLEGRKEVGPEEERFKDAGPVEVMEEKVEPEDCVPEDLWTNKEGPEEMAPDVYREATPTYLALILSYFGFGPAVRDFNVLCCCIQQSRLGHVPNRNMMNRQELQAALLRLFERYLEAAPQVVLQLYIIINHTYHPDSDIGGDWVIHVSCLFSLVSLALSITTYTNASKFHSITCRGHTYVTHLHSGIPHLALALHFLWNFCFICSRVWALAVFAYAFPIIVFAVCGVHWFCSWIWITYGYRRKNDSWNQYGLSRAPVLLVNISCGFMYIFTLRHVRNGELEAEKRKEYAAFYCIYLVQNLFLIGVALIYLSAPPVLLWVSVSSILLFMFGTVLMVVYYRWLHPTVKHKFRTDP